MKSIRTFFQTRNRVKRHKIYVYEFMISLHNECERLRLDQLTSVRDKKVIQKIIFKTNLARKYKRRLQLLEL